MTYSMTTKPPTISDNFDKGKKLFYSLSIKDRKVFIQLLMSIKYPISHVLEPSTDSGYYRIYRQYYKNGTINKKSFYKEPSMEIIKLKSPAERIGKDYTFTVMEIERILSLFYISYGTSPVSFITLLQVLEEFIANKYNTIVKYTKTDGKNSSNFIKNRGAGPKNVRYMEDTVDDSHWLGYKGGMGFLPTPKSPTVEFIPPDKREITMVLFNPEQFNVNVN